MSKCDKGQIERVGYSFVKKKTGKKVSVGSSCISDKGKPGKGPKLITIPEYDVGLLSKYGYSLAESHERRVTSLKKAIKSNSELKILRHINALRTLLKSSPKLYNKLDKDMKWIQKDYAIKKGGDEEPILEKKSSKKVSKKSSKKSTKKTSRGGNDKEPWSLINFRRKC